MAVQALLRGAMKSARALALLATLSCASPDEAVELEDSPSFGVRPIHLVVSPELPDECVGAVHDAVLWWRTQGVTFTMEIGEGWEPSLHHVAVAGQVAIVEAGGFGDAETLAETRVALTAGGAISAAEIETLSCERVVMAHELGHALGLPHQSGTIMADSVEGAIWALTPQQRAFAAD